MEQSAVVGRFLVDGEVASVRVERDWTVATMRRSDASTCPSESYVLLRDRPDWQRQTARLLQAAEEGARLRVSFGCLDGRQTINAIQFLTPRAAHDGKQGGAAPPAPVATGESAADAAGAVPQPPAGVQSDEARARAGRP